MCTIALEEAPLARKMPARSLEEYSVALPDLIELRHCTPAPGDGSRPLVSKPKNQVASQFSWRGFEDINAQTDQAHMMMYAAGC